ncbi:extracellular solute-binding protein [Paenibacillus aestuarii]|uniref:Extracellular solute-binding protein n=1 Tax=Paenibacillus aestuarii TaxID=516965 RepID=A0ABW0KDZ1_9BACL|nr:extracellular solute-binding protein [Paenibacillus aestuarii]
MKKRTFLLMAAMLVVGMLEGCAPDSKTTSSVAGNTSPQDDLKDKLAINITTISYEGGGWPDHHPMIDFLNKKFNIDLNIQWIPADSYSEKLNVLAASGEFPDAFLLQRPDFLKFRDKGVFLDVKPLLAKYPNLVKNLGGDKTLQYMNPNGKYFGLPYYGIETRDSLGIRKDWLDKLGLQMPTTTDDFLKVTTAFATQDPDGNGKNDTIGFSAALTPTKTDFQFIDQIKMAFGLVNGWGLKDGKLISWHTQNRELKDFATFMNKAYTSGALDKDFAVNKNKDPQDKYTSGKVGTDQIVPTQVYQNIVPPLLKVDPKAETVQLLPPKGPTGLQGTTTSSATQKVVINAKIDPKKQDRIMKLFDYFLSDEGNILTKNGIEGLDYKKDGNSYVKLPDFDKDRPYLISIWLLRRNDPNIQIRLWDDQTMVDNVNHWFKNNAPYKKPNEAAGLESATDTKLGPNIDVKFMGSMVKVIMGEQPIDSIDQAVEQWKKDGGDKITQEYNDAYQALQK